VHSEACNHLSLVSKDYHTDREAIESRPAPKDDREDEELTTMFQQLVVSKGKKSQLCQDEYIFSFLFLAFRIYQRHTVHWQRLTAENIAKDGDRCNDCIRVELARKARRKSQALNKDSNLPPDSAKIRKLLELLKDSEINGREDDSVLPVYIDA
jgi:hypothetical protein